MKVFCLTIVLFCSSLGFSQRISEFEKTLNVENLPFSDTEIRVYKDHSISTGLELFRIYYDESIKDWKAAFYYTVAKKTEDDSFEIVIQNLELKSIYNTEYLALQLLTSDIQHLPNDDAIRYKLKPKKAEIILEEGVFLINTTMASIVDGVSYYVQVKDGKDFNEIHYNNPESYLEDYPTVDELISFNEFLDIIKKNFNVFEDYKKLRP